MRAPIPGRYAPVQIRIVGEPEAVASMVALLMAATEVDTVTHPIRSRTPGHVRVYVTASRRFPLTGGLR